MNTKAINAAHILIAIIIIFGAFSFAKHFTRPIAVMVQKSNLAAVSGAGSGLIAHYAFEGSANDSVGLNNGTITGAPATVAGHTGNAFSFNGGTDRVRTTTAFSNLASLSAAFWLKADNTSNAGQIAGTVNSNTQGWKVGVGANNIQFTVDYDGTDLDVRSSASSLDTSWAHWVVTWDGSMLASGVHIYKNGVEVSYSVQRDAVGNRVSDSGRNMDIGNNGLGNRGLAGTLDDLYIYSRVISSSDIAELSGSAPSSGGNQNQVTSQTGNTQQTSQSDVVSPGVTLTSPAASQSVSGTITLSASASDNVGVVGVQFMVDGTNIGSEDTSSPYSASWNSASVSDGTHSISARARDAAGNTQSSAVTVTVANQSQAQQAQSVRTPRPATISWTSPLGIPDPVTVFGAFDPIRGDHFMYQLNGTETCSTNPGKCFNFGNGLEPYRDNGNGPYTHYVDNTLPLCSTGQNSGCSTDTGNTYGTSVKPRRSIPSGLPAGSVVEVHGGTQAVPYSPSSSWYVLSGAGTANQPVFYRGINDPIIYDRSARISGSYVVIEGFETYGDKAAFSVFGSGNHHIVIRDNYLHNKQPSTGGNSVGAGAGSEVVIYNNHVFDNGSPECPGHPRCGMENDVHGVHVGNGAFRVWILDNNIHQNGGDAVQVNGGINEPYPDYVYIGRNHMREDGENAVDIKTAKHVIISQNNMYGYGPTHYVSSGSDGTAVVINDDNNINGLNNSVWVMFNNIHDANNGIRTQAYAYVIGNVIHDISNAGIISFGGHDIHIENNTLYNMPKGIDRSGGASNFKLQAYNNILANISDLPLYLNNAMLNSRIEKNDFYPNSKISWRGAPYPNLTAFIAAVPTQCAGCITTDPQMTNPAGGDYRLGANSSVKNAALPSTVYNDFYATYGIDIRKDYNGVDRPQEGAWDMGAFEYFSGQPVSNPLPQTPFTPPAATPSQPNGQTNGQNNGSATSTAGNANNQNAPGTPRANGAGTAAGANGNNGTNGTNGVNQAVQQIPGCTPGALFSTMTGQRCLAGAAQSAQATGGSSVGSSYAFTRNLNVGSRGDDVRALQAFLNTTGFNVSAAGAGSRGNETVYFGPATRSALARYQASIGLTADGIFGPRTRASLGSSGNITVPAAAQPANTQSADVSGGVSIRLGSNGPAVKILRQKLRAAGYLAAYGSSADVPASAEAETSNFGSVTEAALKRYQCEKGIVCSGSAATTGWGAVGARTRAALGM